MVSEKKQFEPLVEVKNLKIYIDTDEGVLKAVNGTNFLIYKGKTLGLVGESGCGKSLTSKAIMRLNQEVCQVSGQILLKDKNKEIDVVKLKRDSTEIRSLRGKKVSMIFQEPMTAFSPLYTIGNQIMEMILLHETNNKKEARNIALEMLSRVGIDNAQERIDQYPHEFSGGMRQRAMIAMALSCNPELLIADEPTTALDVTIQAQVLEIMKGLQKDLGMAILFITHDLSIIAEMSDEVAVMYLGKIIEKADVKEIFKNPKHPYTAGLLSSIPKMNPDKKEKLQSIPGNVPLPIDLTPMCTFYERCDYGKEGLCDVHDIPEIELSSNHKVNCFLYDQTKEMEDANV